MTRQLLPRIYSHTSVQSPSVPLTWPLPALTGPAPISHPPGSPCPPSDPSREARMPSQPQAAPQSQQCSLLLRLVSPLSFGAVCQQTQLSTSLDCLLLFSSTTLPQPAPLKSKVPFGPTSSTEAQAGSPGPQLLLPAPGISGALHLEILPRPCHRPYPLPLKAAAGCQKPPSLFSPVTSFQLTATYCIPIPGNESPCSRGHRLPCYSVPILCTYSPPPHISKEGTGPALIPFPRAGLITVSFMLSGNIYCTKMFQALSWAVEY